MFQSVEIELSRAQLDFLQMKLSEFQRSPALRDEELTASHLIRGLIEFWRAIDGGIDPSLEFVEIENKKEGQ